MSSGKGRRPSLQEILQSYYNQISNNSAQIENHYNYLNRENKRLRQAQERLNNLANMNSSEIARHQAQIDSINNNIQYHQSMINNLQDAHRVLNEKVDRQYNELKQSTTMNTRDIRRLEELHETSMRRIEDQFAQVSRNIDEVSREAQIARETLRTELNTRITEVHRQLEEERQLRLNKIASQRERAQESIKTVQQRLTSYDAGILERLNLDDTYTELKHKLEGADSLLQSNDTEAALGIAEDSFRKTLALDESYSRRQEYLELFKTELCSKIEDIRQGLEEEDIVKLYKHQKDTITRKLDELQEKVERSYLNYTEIQDSPDRDPLQMDLAANESEYTSIMAEIDDLKAELENRKKKAVLLVKHLTKKFGQLSEKPGQALLSDDPKDDIMLTLKFVNGTVIYARIERSGEVRIDLAGLYDKDCEEMAYDALNELSSELDEIGSPEVQTIPERQQATENDRKSAESMREYYRRSRQQQARTMGAM